MKNLNFKAIIAKMEILSENEKGKLKGGIKAIQPIKSGGLDGNNNQCHNSVC
ncbi:hypothetical protein CHRY9293_00514 [Chryseobacterium potabilaquae]|uniref:Uncharacterized protein n=1 Tax=Chryseobacterium potabilaquae TaxID=2675057 RepID=A0A6N4X4L0_9FLAO|nr:hypothetical protein CHRY9293_00514 [Chryseobacterium potabilaquae]